MSRNLPAAMQTALEADVVRPVFIGEFEFASGTVRLWSGVGDLSWDAQTWAGVGDLAGIDLPEESNDGAARPATFTLTGAAGAWNSLAFEEYQGRPCRLWFGVVDGTDTLVVPDDPHFDGRMDVMDIRDTGDSSIIVLTAEHEYYDNRPSNDRYDHQDQQRRFAGDKGLEYLADLIDKDIPWGIPNKYL